MSNSRRPRLFDLVAVLRSPSDQPLTVGDVGTVVDLLSPDGLEIEFLDRSGHTRLVATLQESDVLVLNRERTPVG